MSASDWILRGHGSAGPSRRADRFYPIAFLSLSPRDTNEPRFHQASGRTWLVHEHESIQ
jgi:hypothetical protein